MKNILNEMVENRITPGGVLLATLDGKIVLSEVFGTTRYQDDGSRIVAKDTIYDIASVTKVFTATVALILADRQEITLDDSLAKFFPLCSYGEKVTLRHLLTHTSGISIWMARLADQKPDEIHRAVIQALLKRVPGARAEYTNVNSYLLGKVVEKIFGESLDKIFLKEIFRPLGMTETMFNPPDSLLGRIAPTEITEQRGLVRGLAHDESAYALGGVAGHAGLFSTAEDLIRLCQMWHDYDNILSAKLKNSAVLKQTPEDSLGIGFGWMVGWDWMGGMRKYLAGHTGFTGPVIAIAPRFGLSIILLMNSTYPERQDWQKRWWYYEKIMNQLFDNL